MYRIHFGSRLSLVAELLVWMLEKGAWPCIHTLIGYQRRIALEEQKEATALSVRTGGALFAGKLKGGNSAISEDWRRAVCWKTSVEWRAIKHSNRSCAARPYTLQGRRTPIGVASPVPFRASRPYFSLLPEQHFSTVVTVRP